MQQVLTRCSPGAHQVLARCSPGARQVLTRCSSGAHSRAHRAAPMGVLLTTKWKGCLGQVGEREGVVTVNGVQRWGAKCMVLAPDAEVPERGGLEIALTSTPSEAAACSIQSSTYPFATSLTTITYPTPSSVVSPGGLDAAPIPTHHHSSQHLQVAHGGCRSRLLEAEVGRWRLQVKVGGEELLKGKSCDQVDGGRLGRKSGADLGGRREAAAPGGIWRGCEWGGE
ncbi:unnamed protein product [Closterium sp. NIES-65]|nr:unnamed protein product [Closterium sp. NIES-65]CAI5999018.1 unnamed protein product [Closterium sp. NIES-65]